MKRICLKKFEEWYHSPHTFEDFSLCRKNVSRIIANFFEKNPFDGYYKVFNCCFHESHWTEEVLFLCRPCVQELYNFQEYVFSFHDKH